MESKKAICPSCGNNIGEYRIDLTTKQKNHGFCNKCHAEYTVEHRRNSLKIHEGYK